MRGSRGRPNYIECRECSYYRAFLKSRRAKRSGGRFFKWLVSAVVLHGMICVSMSYALAWKEHTQVVETVSATIITEIVAPIVVYGFTKTVENIFQKNRLSFSEPIGKENITQKLKNKASAWAEESEEEYE